MTMNAIRQPVIQVRPVAAGRGLAWWSESFSWLFGSFSNFALWVALTLFLVVSTFSLWLLTFVGTIAAALAWFFLWGGLMRAAQRTAGGEAASFGDLAAGFGPSSGALAGAAILTLIVSFAVGMLLLVLVFGASLAAGGWLFSNASLDDMLDAFARIGSISLGLFVLCLLPLFFLQMALWLAPALIVVGGVPLGEALRLSFVGCCRNWLAVGVYSLAFVFLMLLATLPIGLGWIALLPLCFLSSYAAYRDMFEASLEVLEAAPAAGR
jgi:hypothetical protein